MVHSGTYLTTYRRPAQALHRPTPRSPAVGDVDDEPRRAACPGQREGPHREPGADAEPERRRPLVGPGPGHLPERVVGADVDQLPPVGRGVGRPALLVV